MRRYVAQLFLHEERRSSVPKMSTKPAVDCDIIVVGGGSAGCAMAARLADAGLQVTLLEAGKSDADVRIRVPALTMTVVHNPNYDWGFPAEPDPSVGGRADKWPAGKRLGGGSAINGMIYVRGHAWDYDRWAQLGALGWSAADVLPYFRRIETNGRAGDGSRGDSGPISVSDNRVHYPIIDAFVEAAVAYGIPRNPDHNGIHAGEGTDYAQASQRNGLRCSSAQGYLHNGSRRPGLTVRTEVMVRRILLEGGRAVGVECQPPSRPGTQTLRAKHGVVVCAGALNSPRLLMLSGIGPEDHLRSLGIPVVRNLPGVGSNLQEHVGTHVVARVNTPTINSATHGFYAVRELARFVFRRRGAITTSMCHAQAFVRTNDCEPVPDVQISFTAFAFDINAVGRAVLHKQPAVSLTICVARPRSRGRIMLRANDPLAPPIIRHELLGASEDIERLARGITMGRELLAQPALAPYILEETRPGPSISEEGLRNYVRRAAIPLYHPVGTCRIGQDDLAVVDPDLRVRGVSQLWVADASVMPTLPVGNTNATAIMIGDKGADHVLRTVYAAPTVEVARKPAKQFAEYGHIKETGP
jgi:choline dehydrogenase